MFMFNDVLKKINVGHKQQQLKMAVDSDDSSDSSDSSDEKPAAKPLISFYHYAAKQQLYTNFAAAKNVQKYDKDAKAEIFGRGGKKLNDHSDWNEKKKDENFSFSNSKLSIGDYFK